MNEDKQLNPIFSSHLADLLDEFVAEKKACGYRMHGPTLWLQFLMICVGSFAQAQTKYGNFEVRQPHTCDTTYLIRRTTGTATAVAPRI